jgi:hypothetical protein
MTGFYKYALLSTKSTARGCANIQVKNYLGVITLEMEEIVLDSGKERERLLAELEKYGIILPQTASGTAVDNAVLRRFLDKLGQIYGKADLSKKADRTPDPIEWYTQLTADYVYKLTLASVLFFVTFPWMAFWWPPYYFHHYRPLHDP